MTRTNRRRFLQRSAAGVAVGLIGCGGMGNADLRDMLRAGAQAVALCDVDDEQVAKTKATIAKTFNQTPDTQQALWECDGFSMIWEHATAVGQGPYMRDHGVAFHGNNGVLVVDRGGWEVLPETETKSGRKAYRMAGEPRRGTGGQDSHLLHVQNFLDCMDSRQAPRSDVEIGHNSMIACHLANIAFRVGRRVAWDVEQEQVVGDAKAQRLVTKAYRAPWTLATSE